MSQSVDSNTTKLWTIEYDNSACTNYHRYAFQVTAYKCVTINFAASA